MKDFEALEVRGSFQPSKGHPALKHKNSPSIVADLLCLPKSGFRSCVNISD